ncbi:MAG TPA: glutathione S-transferase family protein [Polyangiales bacterium]|nr:glutathione S-transferase family protein [Polyangiales bacterium]
MPEIKLFSARACPYAHRTRLVLSHKQLPFELVEIDLQNKPAWFDSKVSGYGKVPALQHGDVYLWESAIVNEYLDEVFPEPALLPREPVARARARIWVDYANTRFATSFGALLRASVQADLDKHRKELTGVLDYIEHAGLAQLSGDGPFFLGREPSLVDYAFYPWIERWPGLEHHRKLALPPEHTRLARWHAAVRELPAVREHENPASFYIERYARIAAPTKAA